MKRKSGARRAGIPVSAEPVAFGVLLMAARMALPAAFLIFLPALLEHFEAPKAAAVRVLGLAALAVGLTWTRGLGSARWGVVDLALAAWLAVEVLSTILSDSFRISLLGEPEQREGLITSVSLAGLFLAARLGSRSEGDVRGTLDVALVSAGLASLYAVAQAAGIDPVHWGRTSGFAGLSMRPFGTLGHPNLLGLISGAAASAGLAMALLHPARRARYTLITIVTMVATLLTLSRGAWLGTSSGLIVALVLAWRARAIRPVPARARWVAAAAVLAALAGVTIAAGLWWGEILRERVAASLAAGGGGSRARLEIWRAALAAWSSRPFLGHGPDTFSLNFTRYQTAAYWRYEWGGLPLHAHSIYFHTLATRGILGVAAMGGGLAAAILAARAAWRTGEDARRLVAALAAAACALCVSGAFGSIGLGGMVWLFLIAAGIATLATQAAPATVAAHATVATAPAGKSGESPLAPQGDRPWPLLAGGAAALLALAWATVDLSSAWQDRRGLDYMQLSTRLSGESALMARRAAARSYEKAAALMPFEDAIARRRADALRFLAALEPETLRVLEEAERQAERSVAMAPLRSLNHRFLGLIRLSEASLSHPERIAGGEAAYARSLDLAPRDALVMMELANAEVELGRPREALAPASRAAALYPEYGSPLAVLARVHRALGDEAAARAALERALAGEWLGDEEARSKAERTLHEGGSPLP